MKEGYIVWNLTNYGDGYEFFGVYKSYKKALKCFRRIVRERYGKCPRGDYSEISDWLCEIDNGGDSFRITLFKEYLPLAKTQKAGE